MPAPDRVTLRYKAPVKVTVNLKTRQVERVCVDTTSCETTNDMIDDADNDGQAYWGGDRHQLREDAWEIAASVDWPTTEVQEDP